MAKKSDVIRLIDVCTCLTSTPLLVTSTLTLGPFAAMLPASHDKMLCYEISQYPQMTSSSFGAALGFRSSTVAALL